MRHILLLHHIMRHIPPQYRTTRQLHTTLSRLTMSLSRTILLPLQDMDTLHHIQLLLQDMDTLHHIQLLHTATLLHTPLQRMGIPSQPIHHLSQHTELLSPDMVLQSHIFQRNQFY